MNKPPIPKIPREKIPEGANLCEYCTAKCCKYFALPMDKPETEREFDFMRWFLLHDRAAVFIEDDIWYILVHTTCKHLMPDNRCGIYLTRPQICREYHTDNCEYEDHFCYDGYFEMAEQVDEYISARFHNRPDHSQFRSPQRPALPILN